MACINAYYAALLFILVRSLFASQFDGLGSQDEEAEDCTVPGADAEVCSRVSFVQHKSNKLFDATMPQRSYSELYSGYDLEHMPMHMLDLEHKYRRREELEKEAEQKEEQKQKKKLKNRSRTQRSRNEEEETEEDEEEAYDEEQDEEAEEEEEDEGEEKAIEHKHAAGTQHGQAPWQPSFVKTLEWDVCNVTVHSNLGGAGPDTKRPKELRFLDIGSFYGQRVDLVIKNLTEYHAHDAHRNTQRMCFIVINMMKGHQTKFVASFVVHNTNEVISAGNQYFSIFDLDCSATGTEQVTVEKGYTTYYLDDTTELGVQGQSDGKLNFIATAYGDGSDNPPPMEDLQRQRTVTLQYPKSSFAFTLGVKSSKRGRNFLFAGKTTLVPVKPGFDKPGIPTPSAPNPTPAPTQYDCSQDDSCIIWGDPHVITFDIHHERTLKHPLQEAFFRTHGWKADQMSIYDEGTYWLVNSKRIRIQGRYWHNKTHPEFTNIGALAISGPFIKDNLLIIRALENMISWNGMEILPMAPSYFENRFVHAKYHSRAEIVANGKTGLGLEFQLPDGVRLSINRWNHQLAVKIDMCRPQALKHHDAVSGQCGNFNGNAHDDFTPAVRLQPEEWLF